MVIPYGAASVAAGIALFFLNLTNLAGTALVAGATALAASVLSLQEWKSGSDTKLYTLTSAACAGFVGYTAATSLSALKGAPYWLAAVLVALSAAAAAFCLYNVAAGGNPPPKKGKAAPAAQQ
ncbi:hypothetical protein GPECTOR_6g754 [Gonium pectorale]|uniref:Uncharacterized protein n=1 Tax=Gonium pectorale TaxID=33097 RepID=A0A150GVC7_GONPE|nr:hypothetical protein GPECTOR_6g754 [Gonium pectorale]|eukprot:KXZ53836.1 hypothetical protein GPECTOR_6g754 [Gonium pectorale]